MIKRNTIIYIYFFYIRLKRVDNGTAIRNIVKKCRDYVHEVVQIPWP